VGRILRFALRGAERRGCDAVAYYVETKYQVAPQWYGALRWNQALFEKISNGEGREITWDRNACASTRRSAIA
jgi:hypothetical protein